MISFSLVHRKPKLDDVVAANSQAVARVIEFLDEQGVQNEDITTDLIQIRPVEANKFSPINMAPQSNFSAKQMASPAVPPNRKPPEKSQTIFQARRSITLTVHDLTRLEKIYTGLLKNGVNEIAGVRFETSELRKYRDQARKKAIQAAREKAAALAAELGADLLGAKKIHRTGR